MVGFSSDKPIVETIPEEVRAEEDEVDQNDHQESDEEKENPEEESIEKTPKLSDDVVAQEPQVKESDGESRPIVSSSSASCSAINEDKVDQDDPKESDEEKENPQEESTEKTPELSDDVVAQEMQVKESDESTSIVSGSSASCSAINETELKKTDEASKKKDPSSSRSSETSEIKIGEREDDRSDDDDSKDSEFPYPEYDDTSSVITQPEEILSTLPLHQNPNRSSETESQVMVLPQENFGLGSLGPWSPYQISRSPRMVNQQQRSILPNQPFGMQQPPPTMMLTTQPRPSVVDHNYGAGFDPMAAPWRPRTITSLGPRNIYPSFSAPLPSMMFSMSRSIVAVRSYSDQPSGMQHQMDIDPNIVRAQALRQHLMRLEDNPQLQSATHSPMIPVTNEQNQIVAYQAPWPAPMMQAPMMPMTYHHVQMRPEANQQDEIAPNLLIRPESNQQNQIVPYIAPEQAPMMHPHVQMRPEANQQDRIAPNLLMSPGTNQQNQIVPYLAPEQAPMMHQHVQMRPVANLIYRIVPNLRLRPVTNQQNQIVAFIGPRMPVMYEFVRMIPEANQQYQIVPELQPRPVANQQNQMVPYLASGQAPAIPMVFQQGMMIPETDLYAFPGPVMYNLELQFWCPQMFTVIPLGWARPSVVNMIDQASPNAAAAPRPENNQQQMLQLQSQAQQTTQSQRFDAGSSSEQSQD